MYLQHDMNTIDSTKLIELADADYNMLKEKGKEGEKVLHYNGFLDGFARGLYEGSNPWHKASEELPTHFGDYLVVIKSQQFGRRYALKCWYGYPNDPFGDNPSKEWALEDDEIVTHWMEIPNARKPK